MKYGDGQGVTIDMKGLRKAVARGEVKGVEIVEHDELIDYINTTKDLSNFERRMARRFANKDNEFLIKGIIPARFLKIRGY